MLIACFYGDYSLKLMRYDGNTLGAVATAPSSRLALTATCYAMMDERREEPNTCSAERGTVPLISETIRAALVATAEVSAPGIGSASKSDFASGVVVLTYLLFSLLLQHLINKHLILTSTRSVGRPLNEQVLKTSK